MIAIALLYCIASLLTIGILVSLGLAKNVRKDQESSRTLELIERKRQDADWADWAYWGGGHQ